MEADWFAGVARGLWRSVTPDCWRACSAAIVECVHVMQITAVGSDGTEECVLPCMYPSV